MCHLDYFSCKLFNSFLYDLTKSGVDLRDINCVLSNLLWSASQICVISGCAHKNSALVLTLLVCQYSIINSRGYMADVEDIQPLVFDNGTRMFKVRIYMNLFFLKKLFVYFKFFFYESFKWIVLPSLVN